MELTKAVILKKKDFYWAVSMLALATLIAILNATPLQAGCFFIIGFFLLKDSRDITTPYTFQDEELEEDEDEEDEEDDSTEEK